MPVIAPVLQSLIVSNVADAMRAASTESNPTSADFKMMCQAIAMGVMTGSPTIGFTTADQGGWGGLITPTPIPAPGVGTGVGITVDAEDMDKRMYEYIYAKIKEKIPDSVTAPYPPPADNTGVFLHAITKGVADAIKTHFATCWVLASVHPTVSLGTGTIAPGKFIGLQSSLVKTAIMAAAPTFTGIMWPDIADGIAKGYCESILQKASGKVTISGVAGPPSSGTGTGAAA